MSMEAVRQSVETLPITPTLLKNLRETSRLRSTHYSTMIEGNKLTLQETIDLPKGGRLWLGNFGE